MSRPRSNARDPSTQVTLLARIRDWRDRSAWVEFDQLYRPLIQEYCRRRGLQPNDVDEVCQVTMSRISTSIRSFEYDAARGRFRSWLFSVVRSAVVDLQRRSRAEQATSAAYTAHQADPAAVDCAEREWDQEYARYLLEWASRSVRATTSEATWTAFWQTMVLGRPAVEVGQELNLSVNAVYLARTRVLSKIREHVRQTLGDELGL